MSTSPLFELSEGETFTQKLASLTELHLDGVFPHTILARGFTSYNNNCVENVKYSPGQVKARTVGQDVYETTLTEMGRKIFGDCTCPFDGRCKHQAALLIYLIRDADKADFQEGNQLDGISKAAPSFREYLETLKKEELLELVLRFAPESFEESIQLRFVNQETKYKIFLKGKKKVQNIFSSDLYDIASFEEDLTEATEELRALWPHLPEELTDLFVYIIDQVSESLEEGYLYDDLGDDGYDGFIFGTYLAEFTADLPIEKLEKLAPKIWAAILGMGFAVFENFFWELIDLLPTTHYATFKQVSLANYLFLSLNSRDQIKYYEILDPVFTEVERGILLEKLSERNNYFAGKLVAYWEEKTQIDKAVAILNDKLKPTEKENSYFGYSIGLDELYEKRIELEELHYKGEETALYCLRYLSEISLEKTLRFVVRIFPQKRSEFEKILEQKNPTELATYLEKENRLTEIPPLFDKYSDRFWGWGANTPYAFFQRHKSIFREGALKVFEDVLEKELEHTGDRHYEMVTKTLLEMKSIKDPAAFHQQLIRIKATYKRRHNLMAMLKEAGL